MWSDIQTDKDLLGFTVHARVLQPPTGPASQGGQRQARRGEKEGQM